MAWRVARLPDAGKLLARAARHAARAERFTHGELSIAVVGARRMSRLHERHAGRRGATDVLTFDLGTDRQRGVLDAEIVVCADVARRRAPARPASRRAPSPRAVQAELALYVVHGLLHLAGYDDHAPRGFAAMHAREDALLSELGLGALFSAGNERRGVERPRPRVARPARAPRRVQGEHLRHDALTERDGQQTACRVKRSPRR